VVRLKKTRGEPYSHTASDFLNSVRRTGATIQWRGGIRQPGRQAEETILRLYFPKETTWVGKRRKERKKKKSRSSAWTDRKKLFDQGKWT